MFNINDPKPRIIHKASVRDRLLHQAIYRIIYPIFDNDFIFDSYSSRDGKGTHVAIKRLEKFLRKLSKNYTAPVYALKCDIKKFFDSIDHVVLLEFLEEKINCTDTLELFKKIIDSFHKSPGKGLPLGNVTSQVFANVYMNKFDWYVKRELGVKYYLRYCDDFIILSNDKNIPIKLLPYMVNFLHNNLKLELHPNKIIIRKFHQGIDFLGAVLLPYRIVPRTKTKNRIIKKSQKLLEKVENGKVSKEYANQAISSWLGHLGYTKSRKVRNHLHSVRIKLLK